MTKQEAIEEHRKMWNWIADEYARNHGKIVYDENCELNITKLKSKYFSNYPRSVTNNCFCCDYVGLDSDDSCNRCPLQWIDSNDNLVSTCCFQYYNTAGLYSMLVNISESKWCVDTKLCEDIARKIANLEEKEDEINRIR